MSIVHEVQQTLRAADLRQGVRPPSASKVVSAEHDAGWVAHYAYRLDQMWERHHNWLGRGRRARTAAERVPAHEHVLHVPEGPGGGRDASARGARPALWASDYPHSDSTWPHSQKVIERDFAGVPDDDVAAILHDNAAALYGLPS